MHKTALTAAFTAAALTLIAAPAFAQSELDRLEVVSEAVAQNMAAFLVARVPELADVMVDWEWDAEMREVATCTMDRIRTEGGDQALTDYLDALEVFSTIEITSIEQMGAATPIPFSNDVAMQVATECRAMEVSARRMQESGMMEAMMDPAIMGRLMEE